MSNLDLFPNELSHEMVKAYIAQVAPHYAMPHVMSSSGMTKQIESITKAFTNSAHVFVAPEGGGLPPEDDKNMSRDVDQDEVNQSTGFDTGRAVAPRISLM